MPTRSVPLGREDVGQAAARIAGLVRRTPALRCEELESPGGPELWLKAENLQRVGAFKARGAMHCVGRLSTEQRSAGLITFSSGNHAQAVALAASHFGASALIVMPEDAPAIKVAAVRALGAQVEFAGVTSTDRKARALELQAAQGGTIVHPFDDPDIIAGQGTATLEFAEQVAAQAGGDLDALVVPVGGGGLIAGACIASIGTGTKVYAVEPAGCDSMNQSLRRGSIVAVEPGKTIADGLKPTNVGMLNFSIAQEHVAGSYTVTDDEIGRAMITLLMRGHLLVEPSGAAALALALRGDLPSNPRRVGVILSGGNVAPETVAMLLERYGTAS